MPVPLRIILIASTFAAWTMLSTSAALLAADQEQQENGTQKVLVTVNGHAITQADLDFAYLSRGIANHHRPAQKQVLESLVNQRLIQDFLTQQKITVPPQQLDESVLRIQKLESVKKETSPNRFSPKWDSHLKNCVLQLHSLYHGTFTHSVKSHPLNCKNSSQHIGKN